VRYQAPRTFASRAQARDFLRTTAADITRGTWRDPRADRMLFSEWAVEYQRGAVHKRGRTKEKDESIIRRRLNPTFGDMPLASIQPIDVRAWVQQLTLEFAPATVETEYALFRTIMRTAVDADLILVSPCRGVTLPKQKKRADKRRVTLEQVELLASKTRTQYRPIIWLLGVMGLRWSEVAGLTVGRIATLGVPRLVIDQALADVGGRVELDLTKNLSSERTLPMPEFVKTMMFEHLRVEGRLDDLSGFVFRAPRGGPLRYSDFHKTVWTPAVRAAQLQGLTMHALRHSAGGLLRELGMHTQYIARWLGHSDDRTTSREYGWVPDELDQAAVKALDDAYQKRSGHVRGTDSEGGGAAHTA